MLFLGDTLPRCFTLHTRHMDTQTILMTMCEANTYSTSDEREALTEALGVEAATEALFDCLCQAHPRAHVIARVREAIKLTNDRMRKASLDHSLLLSMARCAVVHVDGNDNNGWYALANATSMRGATRHKSKPAAMSVVRSRLADRIDAFIPTDNYSRFRLHKSGELRDARTV